MSADDNSEQVKFSLEIPPGSIPTRAIEIVLYLAPDGQEMAATKWQGTPNFVSELGMIEYAKAVLMADRMSRIGLRNMQQGDTPDEGVPPC